jgi:uncharacterized protein involved in outer membrane biogenesis
MLSKTSLKKLLTGILILLVVLYLAGFFILPSVLKSFILKTVHEKFRRTASIQTVTVNPFTLSIALKGFVVREQDNQETFLSCDEFFIDAEIISLLKKGIVLSEVRIVKPYISIIRNENNFYNFSDLIMANTSQPENDKKPLRYSLNNIQIINGSIDFTDMPKRTKHTVRDARISLPFLSNMPYYAETFVQPSLEAKVNDHAVSLRGKTKPFADSLETVLEISIRDLDIPHYLAYIPLPLPIKVSSGYLDSSSRLSYMQYRDRSPSMTLSGDISFRNIRIENTHGNNLFSLPMLGFSITSAELMTKNIHLSKVLIQSPELTLVRDRTGRLNIQSMFPEKKQGKPFDEKAHGKKNSTLMAEADEIRLTGGKVRFTDHSLAGTFSTTLKEIDFQVDHFSTTKDMTAAVTASARTDFGETINLAGTFSFNPFASEGTARLANLPLKKYSPFYRDIILFDIEDGLLGLSTGFAFKQDTGIKLTGLSASVNSLSLIKQNEDFLRIPSFSVRNTVIDVPARKIVMGELSSGKGIITATRSRNGEANLQMLIRSSGKEGISDVDMHPPQREEKQPWLVVMKKIMLDQYSLHLTDRMHFQPVKQTIDKIQFRGEDLSTLKDSRGKVSFSCVINGNGLISAVGTAGITPLFAHLKTDIRNIALMPFQPYVTDRLGVFVTDGDFSANGSLMLEHTGKKGIRAEFRGASSLAHFSSVDKTNAEEFLAWNSLAFNSMDISYNPLSIAIDEVALTDFYSRIIVNQNGTLNMQDIIAKKAEGPVHAVQPDYPPSVSNGEKISAQGRMAIDRITLQGGTINFTDKYIKPSYTANLQEIGGRVSGLSLEKDKRADVDLRGKLEHYAPLEITGKLNPSRDDFFIDLSVNFKDMETSPLTPYSGKYAGYAIQKGKLSLNLQYLIVNKKLEAQNSVFLDQFTLGEKVESTDATRLPVKLAVALLKNRKGEITIDLPVTGSIDDPKFSLGRIIIKVLVNVLTKAATSPFALLGAVFGSGEELSHIDFDYGSTDINEQGIKKLAALIQALHDRPSLHIDIEGHIDSEKDREGLRQYLFRKKLRTQKLKDFIRKGAPAVPVDEIVIEQTEYQDYLKKAYREEKFPKPRNILGMAKELPDAEMEKLMLAYTEITDDDLRALAVLRARKVKEFILNTKKVEPERVFLLEPNTRQAVKKENIRDSRVDFFLK